MTLGTLGGGELHLDSHLTNSQFDLLFLFTKEQKQTNQIFITVLNIAVFYKK